MQNSSDSCNDGIATAGSKESGLEFGEFPLKAGEAPESATGPADPPQRIQPVSERFPALEKQEIILTFSAQEAKEGDSVTGDFDGWSPDAAPLEKTGDRDLGYPLNAPRSGQYEYRFVVDGRWCEDPQASGRAACPFGGFNSVSWCHWLSGHQFSDYEGRRSWRASIYLTVGRHSDASRVLQNDHDADHLQARCNFRSGNRGTERGPRAGSPRIPGFGLRIGGRGRGLFSEFSKPSGGGSQMGSCVNSRQN